MSGFGFNSVNPPLLAGSDMARFLYGVAGKHRQQGELAKAEDFYKQALAIKANFPECYNDLALVYKSKGNINDAKAC